jgi:hypothetical protein
MGGALGKVLVFGQDHGTNTQRVRPKRPIISVTQANGLPRAGPRAPVRSTILPALVAVEHQPETSRAYHHRVINLRRCIFEASAYVLSLEVWKILKDFLLGCPGCQHVQHVFYADPHATNARTPSTLVWVECNTA